MAVARTALTAAALVAAALPAGCAQGGGSDPCSGVGCSSRGFCVAEEGTAYCACIRGFHPAGLECRPNDPAAACAGIDCSGHGACREAPDGPTCDCNPGFHHLAADDPRCADAECDLVCAADAARDAFADDGSPDGREVGDDDAPDGRDIGEVADCPAGTTSCGAGCADLTDDPANCGRCGASCAPPHAAALCRDGLCEIGACAAGFVDANGNPDDGCELACSPSGEEDRTAGGACRDGADNDCDGLADLADPGCGPCAPEACNGADDDCDGLTDEDVDTGFDPRHCGACGRACPAGAHAAAACVFGRCDVACERGWADADGNLANGCEAACAPTGEDETSCDGRDDDCDGTTDEDWAAGATCGAGPCAREALCWRGDLVCRPRDAPTDAETICSGLVDEDCDGLADCGDPDCGGLPCDDGDPCTFDDRCGAGACRGTSLECPSDACATRSCNGTATCSATYHAGAPCPDDGTTCTTDVCDDAGSCTHPPVADATLCGAEPRYRCCAGACVDLQTDRANCGGCGLACAAEHSCVVSYGFPTCNCHAADDAECPSDQVCSDWFNVCSCTATTCAPGQTCVVRAGSPDYCAY